MGSNTGAFVAGSSKPIMVKNDTTKLAVGEAPEQDGMPAASELLKTGDREDGRVCKRVEYHCTCLDRVGTIHLYKTCDRRNLLRNAE